MAWQERQIPSLKDLHLSYDKKIYPQPRDRELPYMFFVSLFVGARGTGKTYAAVQLLKKYEKYGIEDQITHKLVPQRVILFSPTVEANPIFDSLENLDPDDIHTHYTDDKLNKVLKQIKKDAKETERYKEKLAIWKKYLKASEESLHRFSAEEMWQLEQMGFMEPVKPKYPDGIVTFMVLDDLLGSQAFKSVGRSLLTNLCIKNRHMGICVLIMTQHLKGIPPSIRRNTSLFVIFRFHSNKVTEDLYEEVSNIMTYNKFCELYKYATSKDRHDALVIDFSDDKNPRLKLNFDRELYLPQ